MRKERGFSKVVAAAGLLTVLSMASAPFLAAANPTVIRLWDMHVHDKKFRQNIFKQFNTDNPDIKVEYTSQIGATYDTVLDAAFRVNNPPEIFVPTGAASMGKMVDMGWIKPLDDIAPSKEAFDKFRATFPENQQPFLENINVFKGKTYSWPTKGEEGQAYILLYYNTKLFRQAGLKAADGTAAVPETWDQMREAARKITALDPGKTYGIVFGGKDPAVWKWNIFYSLAMSTGWDLYGWGLDFRTGYYDWHYPGFRRSIQLWLDMKKDGSVFPGEISMDDETARFKFSQDLAGMYFGGPWTAGGLVTINPDLEFDAVMSPTEKKGERKGIGSIGDLASVSEYVVSSKITDPDAVWRVVTFMTSQQYQEEWVKAGGGISVFPQYNKPQYFPHPVLAKIAQLGSSGAVTYPGINDSLRRTFEFFDPGQPDYFNTIQGIYIGKLGFDACDDFERRANAAIDAAMTEANKKYGTHITRADFTYPDWDPGKPYPPPKAKK